MDGTITITLENYAKLINDQNWLRALEEAGVDNWEGIDYAIELLQEKHDNEKVPMEKH